jgi:hypothetical protein
MAIRHRTWIAAALLAAPLAFGNAQRTEQTEESKWGDRIDAGRWVRASNVNGRITVRQGTGDRVELTAVKRWRRGDPASVRIETKKVGDDIQICALYGDQETCNDRRNDRRWGNNRRDNDNNDVSVDFTILLPRDVRLAATTVNGSMLITGATSDVEAATVNGELEIETGGGPLTASTVNGSVRARITGVAATRPMTFTTVNGNVIAELPANAGADVEMTTVNGELRSDFEMSVRGRIDPHNLNVHVGAPGGPRIRLTTVNGSVDLRKR